MDKVAEQVVLIAGEKERGGGDEIVICLIVV
jgi:hypothetical protein